MNTLLSDNSLHIHTLCKNNKVKTLYVFGSILTPKFNKDSDIDFIVDFQEQDVLEYTTHYFNLKFGLEALFDRKIDLLEQQAIKNPYFLKNINEKKQLIYR